MQPLFFLIRLPFFLLAFVLWTAWVILAGTVLAYFWMIILPPAWLFILVPVNFVGAAFTNKPDQFSKYISASFQKWWSAIAEAPEDLKEIYKLYKPIFRWLVEGFGDD